MNQLALDPQPHPEYRSLETWTPLPCLPLLPPESVIGDTACAFIFHHPVTVPDFRLAGTFGNEDQPFPHAQHFIPQRFYSLFPGLPGHGRQAFRLQAPMGERYQGFAWATSVSVFACGVGEPADLRQRAGHFPALPPLAGRDFRNLRSSSGSYLTSRPILIDRGPSFLRRQLRSVGTAISRNRAAICIVTGLFGNGARLSWMNGKASLTLSFISPLFDLRVLLKPGIAILP